MLPEMIPWELLDSVTVPGSGEVVSLHRRGGEFSINVDGSLLMNNLTHSSEDELARIGCGRMKGAGAARGRGGGLGRGFTLAAALARLGPDASVDVAELLPAVVDWNRGPLSHLAGHPLRDKRVTVLQKDIALVLRAERAAYDAILQDVDNGPEGQTMRSNDWLYGDAGLAAAAAALRPNGILALWSAKPNKKFVKRMRKAGFEVEEVPVRGRDRYRGAHHIIWAARLLSVRRGR